MRRFVITSADGSVTFRLADSEESFHSISGAYEESQHIYIEHGLKSLPELRLRDNKPLNIFETGFGTGLNCLLTLCNSVIHHGTPIYYCSVDKYPLDESEYKLLNHANVIASSAEYCGKLSPDTILNLSEQMQKAEWNKRVQIGPGFVLEKVSADLTEFNSDIKFDLFFHDAFSPEVNPELWSREIFQKFAAMASPGAILVTYSSKGLVKENLRASGFTVRRFDGINGKRHNLFAQIQF